MPVISPPLSAFLRSAYTSLIKRMNSKGDNGSPCFTPSKISKKLDTSDCILLYAMILPISMSSLLCYNSVNDYPVFKYLIAKYCSRICACVGPFLVLFLFLFFGGVGEKYQPRNWGLLLLIRVGKYIRLKWPALSI